MKTVQKILTVYGIFLSFSLYGGDFRQERIVNLRGVWKFSIGDNLKWAQPDFDDSNWEKIYVPSTWEDEGFNGYDGYAWYRVNFELSSDVDLGSLSIELGYIDDVDEVYINGQLIGFTGGFPPDFYTAYNAFRKYPIPSDVINVNGINTIAVRVYDTILEGGIMRGNVGIYHNGRSRVKAMQLNGIWKIREGDREEWKETNVDDSNWVNIMVPSHWRSLKYMFDPRRGFAWYRKEFTLSPELRDVDDLVIVLGKIDDFDEAYLNGHLIGWTNDDRRYGSSNSYRETRIYDLPEEYLKRNGKNVIAVKVEDLGGNAGIYEGPIGICPADQYRRFID